MLTKNGMVGKVANVTMSNNIKKPQLTWVFFNVLLFVLATKGFSERQNPTDIQFGILEVLLLLDISKSLNNFVIHVVIEKKANKILFDKVIRDITQSYFIVCCENENGQTKQRLILL